MEKVLFIVLKHQIDLEMEAMEHLMEMEEMEDLNVGIKDEEIPDR